MDRMLSFINGVLGMMVAVFIGWTGFVVMDPVRVVVGTVLFALTTVLAVISLVEMVHNNGVQTVRRTDHLGGDPGGSGPGNSGFRSSRLGRAGGFPESQPHVPGDQVYRGGPPEGEHVRDPLGEDARDPDLQHVCSQAPGPPGAGPEPDCLSYVTTLGAMFMAQLLAHGGEIDRATHPDTITFSIGPHTVEIRGDVEAETVTLKAIRR